MSVKTPNKHNGIFYGNIPQDIATKILSVRETKEVPNLYKYLYSFSDEFILEAMSHGLAPLEYLDKTGGSIEDHKGLLRDYQTVGTAFLYFSKKSILGDAVGVGKTVQIAALLNVLKHKNEMRKFLMAVEGDAVEQTQYELIRKTGLRIVRIPSTEKEFNKAIAGGAWKKADGYIIPHSALKSDNLFNWIAQYVENDRCSLFDTFILDESSVLKNEDTKLYRYVDLICSLVDRAHFMNATVFETTILDIYNQVDILNKSLLPSKAAITRRHQKWAEGGSYWVKENGVPVMKKKWLADGYKNEAEFKQSLQLIYFGRATEEVVKVIEHEYSVKLIEPTRNQMMALGKKLKWNEVLNCPTSLDLGKLSIKMNMEDIPKLRTLVNDIKNEFMEDSILIYTFHKNAQAVIKEEVEKLGLTAEIINGTIKKERRFEIIHEFNNKKCQVLITNIKKSLNLYGGDTTLMYSLETNPSKMEQIRGRIDRHVDDKVKKYRLYVYDHTPEIVHVENMIAKRAKASNDLIQEAKTAITFFLESMEDSDD